MMMMMIALSCSCEARAGLCDGAVRNEDGHRLIVEELQEKDGVCRPF
jgi:hypothetical protein